MVELVFCNLFNINPATSLRLDLPPQNHFMLYSYGEHNSDKPLLYIISCDYNLFSSCILKESQSQPLGIVALLLS